MESKRTDHATQNDVHKDYQEKPSRIIQTPVPVHVVKTESLGAQLGIYSSFVIQPGSANAVMVLPEDPNRVRAVIEFHSTNGFVVLCNTQSAAQAPGNIAATTGTFPPTPAGFMLYNPGTVTVKNGSMVWAVNTDPTNPAYVSVLVERTNPSR